MKKKEFCLTFVRRVQFFLHQLEFWLRGVSEMIELSALNKSFGFTAALSDITMTIEDDEYLTLLGPSGSGKSTLLRLIAGLESRMLAASSLTVRTS